MLKKSFSPGDRVFYDGRDECVFSVADFGTVTGYHADGSVHVTLDGLGRNQDILERHLKVVSK